MQTINHGPLDDALDDRRPLYRRLADRLCADIAAGRYHVGQTLPTELELAGQFQVSRGSIREALQLLAEGGLVERHRKLGTRVLRRTPSSVYVQRMSGLGDTLGFAGDTLMRITDVADVAEPDETALQSETSASGYWLQITGARHLPDQLEASTWSRVFVSGQLSGIRPLLRPEMKSIYEAVEQVYGLRVSKLRHKVTAISLPQIAAATLELPAGVPVLEVQAWLHASDGQLIEFVRSIHSPSRYAMEFVAEQTVNLR